VSVIIPVAGPNPHLNDAIRRALALDYPQFEVIVVADALPPADVAALEKTWQLSQCEYFFRHSLPTATVLRIYRSTIDRQLIVVEKDPSGLRDAMNCGVNIAQYRYIVVLDPAIVYDRKAMLRACAPALRDPQRVVAVSTHLERVASDAGHRFAGGSPGASDGVRTFSLWLDRFERLSSLRSLLDTRLSSRGLKPTPAARDSVVVWRREAVVGAGGFAADGDWTTTLAMVVAQPSFDGIVVRQGELFGRIAPAAVESGDRAASRSQPPVLRPVPSPAREASDDPGHPDSASRRRPRMELLNSESLQTFATTWLAAAAPVAAALGAMSWMDVWAVYVALSFGRALESTSALLVRGSLPGAPEATELRKLLAAAPLEILTYTGPKVILGTFIR
jgi:hypothetical protein